MVVGTDVYYSVYKVLEKPRSYYDGSCPGQLLVVVTERGSLSADDAERGISLNTFLHGFDTNTSITLVHESPPGGNR